MEEGEEARRVCEGEEEKTEEEEMKRSKSISILYSEDTDVMCFFVYTSPS